MARALLEILGDASSAKLAAKETAAVYKTLEHDTKQLAVSAQSSARLQVEASLKKTARLRAEVTAFREIGAAAKAGSREQIAAAELAARAQSRLGKIGPQASITPGGAARIRVLESVKQTEALRAEAAAYREVAAVAVRGSREQIAAAQLATRAEQRLATSLGVSSHEARAFARSASGVERDLSRATRGALAGSGIFRGLGRSIAFASGGFLAFASAGQFIRTSIDAAKEAQVTQRQLGKQLQNDGRSFKDYRGEIDKTNLRLSAMSGFTKDDLDASLTTILRTTSNVSKALRDNALAANIARARHIGLAQAALVVAKTEAGNTTLLRRQGFQISKNATVEQALAIVRAKVAGQARAGTTQQERFGAVLHDSEVIIGAGLLPTLNQYLASGAKWLTQMNESGKLQRDVASASKNLAEAVRGVRAVLSPVVSGLNLLGKISGGTKNEVELLGTAFLLLKTRAALIKWGLIATGEAQVGTAATVAAGKVGVLESALGRLKGLGPIAIAIGVTEFLKFAHDQSKHIATQNGPNFTLKGSNKQFALGGRGGVFGAGVSPVAQGVAGKPLNPFTPSRFGSGDLGLGALFGPKSAAKAFAAAAKAAVTTPRGTSLQGRFNILELRKANAEQTNNQKIVRAILVSEKAILRAQEASAKTLKDKTTIAQSLAGVMGQIRGIDQDAASAAKQAATDQKQAVADAAAAAKQRRQDQRQALQGRLQSRQFRALGLDASGSPLTPVTKSLKRELGTIDKAITGTFLDTKKTQSVLSKIRRVLSGGLGAVTKDVRAQIKSMLDDLDQQLKDHQGGGGGSLTKATKLDSKTILAGLGLNPAQLRAARARLSQVTSAGAVSSGPRTAFAGGFGGVPAIENHLTVNIDGKAVEHSVTKHQQKRRSKNSSQRRGPHAGGGG